MARVVSSRYHGTTDVCPNPSSETLFHELLRLERIVEFPDTTELGPVLHQRLPRTWRCSFDFFPNTSASGSLSALASVVDRAGCFSVTDPGDFDIISSVGVTE